MSQATLTRRQKNALGALLRIGLNLPLGYAGQISLAQAAFVGIGAYVAALLRDQPDAELDVNPEPLTVARLEWEHIQKVLVEHDGNISATARALKMHRRTLQRKLAKPPSRSK